MYCENCGNELNDEGVCSSCNPSAMGPAQQHQQQPVQPVPQYQPNQQYAPVPQGTAPRSKMSKNKMMIIGAVVVAAIIIVAAFAVLTMNSDNGNDNLSGDDLATKAASEMIISTDELGSDWTGTSYETDDITQESEYGGYSDLAYASYMKGSSQLMIVCILVYDELDDAEDVYDAIKNTIEGNITVYSAGIGDESLEASYSGSTAILFRQNNVIVELISNLDMDDLEDWAEIQCEMIE